MYLHEPRPRQLRAPLPTCARLLNCRTLRRISSGGMFVNTSKITGLGTLGCGRFFADRFIRFITLLPRPESESGARCDGSMTSSIPCGEAHLSRESAGVFRLAHQHRCRLSIFSPA